MSHRAKAVLKQLSDVAEDGGAANRNAVLGQGSEESGEGMVDGRGGAEFAENAEDFGTDLAGVQVLLFPAPVVEAEIVAGGAGHAAAAPGGIGVLTQVVRLGSAGRLVLVRYAVLGGHWWALSGGWG